MLGDKHSHSINVKYLIARMYAKKVNLPYINFYTQFSNTRDYVFNRILGNDDDSRRNNLSVQINEDDLNKMNCVEAFESLDYSADFIKKDNLSDTHKRYGVHNTKLAAKIVYDLLTKVYRINPEAVRFVIAEVEDNKDIAIYNVEGVLLKEKRYNRKKSVDHPKSNSEFALESEEVIGVVICVIICIIVLLIWIIL